MKRSLHPIKKCGTLLIIIFVFFLTQEGFSQTLDQQQTIYNGGMSARHLPGYSEWQSFTAGITGTLSKIEMGFFNTINGTGTLSIYSGTGTSGPLLQTQAVTVYCASGNCMIMFMVSAPVTAGQVYTFLFIPGTGIPDPYGVQVEVPGTYPGGEMGLVDPSGTSYPGFDLVFKTYVTVTLPIELVNFDAVLNSENQTELNWTTASELNCDYFTVEKSGDANQYETLVTVKGAGNSDAVLYYNALDEHPFVGINYYRLKQTDYDGKISYSPVVSVKLDYAGLSVISYYNSPVKLLHVSVHGTNNGDADLKIFDLSGKLVYQTRMMENSEIEISMSNFEAGIYFLKVDDESQMFIQKTTIY